MSEPRQSSPSAAAPRRKYVPAIGPRLRWVLLVVVFGPGRGAGRQFRLPRSITFLEWLQPTDAVPELLLPGDVRAPPGARDSCSRALPGVRPGPPEELQGSPNRRAVRVGYALFLAGHRGPRHGCRPNPHRPFPVQEHRPQRSPTADPSPTGPTSITPLLCVWLYVLHRLAGPASNGRSGPRLGGPPPRRPSLAMVFLHSFHPAEEPDSRPRKEASSISALLGQDRSGNFIPAGP
jgi:hypothetical protein